mgnify:CR=1 FL=1
MNNYFISTPPQHLINYLLCSPLHLFEEARTQPVFHVFVDIIRFGFQICQISDSDQLDEIKPGFARALCNIARISQLHHSQKRVY